MPTSASALDGDGSRDAHRCAQASARVGSLRQSVFARLGEYEDVNDAGRARCDPAMHWMLGDKRAHSRAFSHARRAASRPSGSRHLKTFALANLSPQSIEFACGAPRGIAFDMGFQHEPDPRRPGDERLEWPLRLHLPSSAVHAKSGWRRGTRRIPPMLPVPTAGLCCGGPFVVANPTRCSWT